MKSDETHEHRLKRMRMRSWRRGTKEMDLILGPFADTRLGDLERGELDLFDRLLNENDHDIYQWMSGQQPAPAEFAALVGKVAAGFSGGPAS